MCIPTSGKSSMLNKNLEYLDKKLLLISVTKIFGQN